MARLFAIALVVGLLPCGLAGPACAQKFKSTADCIQRCSTRWGFAGMMMGTDAWGSVMHSVGKEIQDWDLYVAKACGEENVTSSSAATALPTSSVAEQTTKLIEQGLGTHSIPSPSPSSSAIPTFTSLRFVASASRLTTSTTTSHSTTATHTSTTPRTTTTSTKPETPTHTTAQPAHTTTQTNSNSNSNSNSNGDSNGSNSNTGSSGNTGSSNSGNTGSSNSGNGGNGSRASNADVQAYLNAHNTIRAQHGAAPVKWDNDAATKAQEWADKCLNKHSGGTLGPLGENLAAGTGTYTIPEAVKDWTDEVSEYNPNSPQASHFTQVVWKATTLIGCAVQTCDGIFAGFGAAQYYVCEYSLQGNVEGEFGANVQA